MPPKTGQPDTGHGARDNRFSTALIYSVTFVVVVVVALGLWQLAYVLLLTFLGILIAMLLRQPAEWIARHTPLGVNAGLALVCLLIVAAVFLFVSSVGPRVFSQLSQLWQQLPGAIESVTKMLQEREWGRMLIQHLTPPDNANGGGGGGGVAPGPGGLLGTISVTLTTTMNMAANLIVVVTLAIFLAVNPRFYRRGALKLFPPRQRDHVTGLMSIVGSSLWKWLLGQMLDMLIVAVAIGLGLWAIGVPLALALGIVAGVLNFVPYVGAFAGAVPAVLMAFSVGFDAALWTVGLFVVVQQLEGNVIMPMIQSRATHLPPALTILAVMAFGVLFGVLGLFLATPLLLVIIVLVSELWVKPLEQDAEPEVDADTAARVAPAAAAAAGPAVDDGAGEPTR